MLQAVGDGHPAAPPAVASSGATSAGSAEGAAEMGANTDEAAPPWEEARQARKVRDPGAPSPADWDAHQATHLPFRIWCPECVKGRRDNPAHQRVPAEVREIPEVGMDYCYLRRAESDEKITILLQKDRDSKAIRAQVVESKGVACEEAVEAALPGIREFRHHGQIVPTADGENAAKAHTGEAR